VRADEALRMTTALGRESEIVLAHVTLARVGAARGDQVAHHRHVTALRENLTQQVSSDARAAAAALLGREPGARPARRAGWTDAAPRRSAQPAQD
jgi:hypothetical protein